jgi:hypothetical protein
VKILILAKVGIKDSEKDLRKKKLLHRCKVLLMIKFKLGKIKIVTVRVKDLF